MGLLTLVLVRRGMTGHGARLLVFGTCASLVVISAAVPFVPDGWPLLGCVLVLAFATLGLFPTYFALSQELSSRHQGKVTGTLGASAHLFLSLAVYPVEAAYIKATGRYDTILMVVGAVPLLAFVVMWVLWPPPKAAPAPPG
jgi:ACS family hexuronate transporter-like MFS transporter